MLQQAKDRNKDDDNEKDKNLRNKSSSLAIGFFCYLLVVG